MKAWSDEGGHSAEICLRAIATRAKRARGQGETQMSVELCELEILADDGLALLKQEREAAALPAHPVADKPAKAVDAEKIREKALEDAAKWVDNRREEFMREHGYQDPETGTLEYGRGAHAEAKHDYETELAEIADGLRSLKSQSAHKKECEA